MARIEENSPIGEDLRNMYPREFLRIAGGNCPVCDTKIREEEFIDELSKKEFKISGLCQACQDSVFKDEEL